MQKIQLYTPNCIKSFDFILHFYNILSYYIFIIYMKSINKLETQAEQVADILKLLAHPKRLLILCKLSM